MGSDALTTSTADIPLPAPRSDGSARIEGDVVTGHGLVKRWGATTALDGASFAVGHGVTGLLGANGSGKTTLLGMVLGLHAPTEGSVRVLGVDPMHAGASLRARVGYAPEHHHLPDDMRAHDFVRHVAEIHGLPRREATARASDVLWHVGLGEERFRPIGTMSTGQRQRIKLAQAIGHDPALVLLDEPTDGLDPVQRDEMLALIRRIGTEFGIDVILSSHLLEEIERVCDAAVILHEGKVVASASLGELTGAGTGIAVEVVDRADELAAALRDRSARVTVEGRALLVEGPDGYDVYDVIRDALVASGAGVHRMGARRVSLEQVFLEVDT